jgi:Tfp pilus assembly protein PilF
MDHYLRALMLMGQQRWEQAEAQLRLALADDNQNAEAHRMLALCLLERKERAAAEAEARQAIHLSPDDARGHLALARVLYDRRRFEEARAAVEEAIRLDARDSDAFALRGWIAFRAENWQAALSAAEHGLAIDPDDKECTNLRAMALVKLGRRGEAGQSIEAALARDPEDATTHANQGWTLLESRQPQKAMTHFREALRLDPNLEWARAGILQSMKAKNFIYRWLLAYFLFMSRLSSRTRWLIVIGLLVLMNLVGGAAQGDSPAAPFFSAVLAVYFVFALLTWLGSPLANLLLMLDRTGRLVLSDEERRGALAVAGVLALAAAMFASAFVFDTVPLVTASIRMALVSIPTAVIFSCARGWPRQCMVAASVGMALLALSPLLPLAVDLREPGSALARRLFRLGDDLWVPALIGSQFLAIGLANVLPRR